MEIVVRPKIPMYCMQGAGYVCVLGVAEAVGGRVSWPFTVVDEAGAPLATIEARGGYDDGGLFIRASADIPAATLADNTLADNPLADNPAAALDDNTLADITLADNPAAALDDNTLADITLADNPAAALADEMISGITARVDLWEDGIAQRQGAVAGPLAPLLEDYVDRLTGFGSEVEVVFPNGNVAARGTFCGVDVWGRATVRTDAGRELEIAPEQATLRLLG